MSDPTVPACYRHPSHETYLRCSRCDRPICPSCMHDATVGHQCPECVAEGRRGQRTRRTVFGGTLAGQHGQVTITLIAINVAVAALVIFTSGVRAIGGGGWGGLLGGSTTAHHLFGMLTGPAWSPDLVANGLASGPSGVATGEYYRLLTAMFLHYGLFHLLLNMWALWVVGGALEPMLGRLRFLALYLLSGLGGGVATYLFAAPGTISAGASGAVFGLFAAFYVLMRRLRQSTSAITMILVINLVLTFLVPQISIWGHLGGLITGGLVALGLAYAPRQYRNPVQFSTIGGVAAVLAVLTLTRTVMLM